MSLVYSDGELIKKVNAKQDLGNVMDITIPTVADLERFKKRPKQASTVRVSYKLILLYLICNFNKAKLYNFTVTVMLYI